MYAVLRLSPCFLIKEQIFLGSSPTHFLCNTFEVYEAFFQFLLVCWFMIELVVVNSILSLPLPLCITSCTPCQICSLHVEWVSIRIFCCPLPLSPCFNLLSHHPWGRLGAEFCHCFDTALSLLMNKWPLSMMEHRRAEEREGSFSKFAPRCQHFEWVCTMEDGGNDDMTDDGRQRLSLQWCQMNLSS